MKLIRSSFLLLQIEELTYSNQIRGVVTGRYDLRCAFTISGVYTCLVTELMFKVCLCSSYFMLLTTLYYNSSYKLGRMIFLTVQLSI